MADDNKTAKTAAGATDKTAEDIKRAAAEGKEQSELDAPYPPNPTPPPVGYVPPEGTPGQPGYEDWKKLDEERKQDEAKAASEALANRPR